MIIGLAQIKDTRQHMGKYNLPAQWNDCGNPFKEANHLYFNNKNKMLVVISEALMNDNTWYLHVSCSYRNKLPSWNDLKRVKNLFIGEDRIAYQVLPKQSEYVNLMPYCLHLWSPLEQ